ncbi:hypothetical protein [Thermoactinospora rubra]|uniref:hypothetical protein n=1 Tax=Thermoactinospora rubra TaxID=1088767 RepID=UPI000A0F60B2|nr:hypothetical protein [Thermoactinospora rubra]
MEIEDFFSRYGEALTRGDLDGIAGCYGYPSFILGDDVAVAVAGEADVKAAFEGAAERYRAQGLVAARPTVTATTRVTDRIVDAEVSWDYVDAEGVPRSGSRYRYTLRATGNDPLIHVVVSIP